MTDSSSLDAEFAALVAAAGLKPNDQDLAELRLAYPSIVEMKARVRAAGRWAAEPAHVFAPIVAPSDAPQTQSTMDSIPVPAKPDGHNAGR